MNKDDFYYLGKISKPFGSKGQVVVILDVDNPLKYKKLGSVYLDLDGEWVPFIIKSVEIRTGQRALFHFEDVNTAEDASVFAGREMYLSLDLLPPLKGNKFYYHEVKDFSVIDAVHGNIGTLVKVLEFQHQSMLQVTFHGKEILVPLVDEVVLKVDRKLKELHIRAPEGLIDIYL
jgi:16S rRNA processing protein RimM